MCLSTNFSIVFNLKYDRLIGQYAILFIPLAKVQDSTAAGKWPFPSKSFAIHYALYLGHYVA
jgi:hypothetical protein